MEGRSAFWQALLFLITTQPFYRFIEYLDFFLPEKKDLKKHPKCVGRKAKCKTKGITAKCSSLAKGFRLWTKRSHSE